VPDAVLRPDPAAMPDPVQGWPGAVAAGLRQLSGRRPGGQVIPDGRRRPAPGGQAGLPGLTLGRPGGTQVSCAFA
jgi:hypothetical protein